MMECPFCNFIGDSLAKVVLENKYCLFMQYYDGIPEGSGLIIPKEHRETAFHLSADEWNSTYSLLHEAKSFIDEQFHPDGYNIGWNIGKIGGQEVFHAHLHIIPRYADELHAGKGIRYWFKQPANKLQTNEKHVLNK